MMVGGDAHWRRVKKRKNQKKKKTTNKTTHPDGGPEMKGPGAIF
jgi:hypothetical protein